MSRKGPSPRTARLSIALTLALLVAIRAVDALGSVALAVTWESLLHESTAAAVVTPADARSVWEAGRIYTYTRVRVDRPFAGELAAGSEAWVRTMGGVVGDIGQLVEGEPAFVAGEPCVLFLHPAPNGGFDVTARGQGQLAVVHRDPKLPARVVRTHTMGEILAPRLAPSAAIPRLADEMLHDRLVDDVAREIAAAWPATHAR